VEITDDMLQSALESRKKLDMLSAGCGTCGQQRSAALSPLMKPSGRFEFLDAGFAGLRDAVEAIDILCEELRARINRGKGVVAKGSPRILGICPGHQTDPGLSTW